MICINTISKYCNEDISIIENYDKAINDDTQIWDCHHRLEIELNLTKQQLIEKDLYYNRSASELIFLTHGEHTALHNKQRQGKKHPLYGKPRSQSTKDKLKDKTTEYMINTKYMCKNNIRKRIKLNDVQKYLCDGWNFCKYKKAKE